MCSCDRITCRCFLAWARINVRCSSKPRTDGGGCCSNIGATKHRSYRSTFFRCFVGGWRAPSGSRAFTKGSRALPARSAASSSRFSARSRAVGRWARESWKSRRSAALGGDGRKPKPRSNTCFGPDALRPRRVADSSACTISPNASSHRRFSPRRFPMKMPRSVPSYALGQARSASQPSKICATTFACRLPIRRRASRNSSSLATSPS